MNKKLIISNFILIATLVTGCANEVHRSLDIERVASYNTTYTGKKAKIAIGKFNNRSSYMNGVFSDGADRMGAQAKNILISHLHQTNHFNILERDNMQEISAEANLAGKKQSLQGAQYIVTGSVAEFGRKQIGDKQLFGILGSGKSQIAYAKISLNIIDTLTSKVVYSSQGSGEYELSNREIIGFGGTASYDSTLNGKVLDLAMREAINTMITDIDTKSLTL